MIDTVRLKVSGQWKGTIPRAWIATEGSKSDSEGRETRFRSLCEESTGFRISGTLQEPGSVEVSLPRLLHGSNGSLLKSEQEVREAFRVCGDRMRSVMQGMEVAPKITRLDAAWNCEIDGGVRSVMRAAENTRHQNVRRATIIHKGESIHWPGAKMRLRVYDKGKEVLGRESDVVRFEAQLRGDHVKPFNEDPTNMGMRAYQTLRELVCKLQPIQEPRFSRVAQFLAYCEQDSVRDSQGRDIVGIFLAGQSRTTRYRMLAQMKKARVQYAAVCFSELFPADRLPPVVEVKKAA